MKVPISKNDGILLINDRKYCIIKEPSLEIGGRKNGNTDTGKICGRF